MSAVQHGGMGGRTGRTAVGNHGGGRLLVLCASVGCLWEQAAAAGGAIFTGRIDAFCVSEMMVRMLLIAMVCGALHTPAPTPAATARALLFRQHVSHRRCAFACSAMVI